MSVFIVNTKAFSRIGSRRVDWPHVSTPTWITLIEAFPLVILPRPRTPTSVAPFRSVQPASCHLVNCTLLANAAEHRLVESSCCMHIRRFVAASSILSLLSSTCICIDESKSPGRTRSAPFAHARTPCSDSPLRLAISDVIWCDDVACITPGITYAEESRRIAVRNWCHLRDFV